MTTPFTPGHVDVAAYLLGILDEPDDAAFAEHFAQCRRCRAEFRELSDLPQLLDQLKPARPERKRSRPPAAPSKQVLTRALDQVSSARRGQRTRIWLGAAAGLVLLVSVSLVVWQVSGTHGQVAGPPVTSSAEAAEPTTTTEILPTGVAGARTVGATNPATGVTGSITMEPESWGTRVHLELRGVLGPLQCQLVAVSKTGASQAVTSWLVPASGFGVPDSPEPLRVQGGIGLELENIERFDIRRDAGPDLLVVVA